MSNKNKYNSIEEIISACADNDRVGQEKLYRLYLGTMVAMCRKYMHVEEDILSVVNDGFLKVFIHLTKKPILTNVEGWIRRIVYNTMIDFHRGNKNYNSKIALVETIFDGVAVQEPYENLDYIYRLIDKLPDISRSVFTKYALEGYSHNEIAKLLDIKENTSKWHLFEARKRLKNWLSISNLQKSVG